jgi:putative transcriptional regulator
MSTKSPQPVDEFVLTPHTPNELVRGEAELVKGGVDADEIAKARAVLPPLAASLPGGAPPSASLRNRLVASMGRGGRFGLFVDRLGRMFDIPIADAEALARQIEDPSAWRPGIIPGMDIISVMPGPKAAGAICGIGRFQPGVTFPHHEHLGEEFNLVLDGGFVEDNGQEIWRGEELYKPAGSQHDFTALPGVPCIAAAVAHGGIDVK